MTYQELRTRALKELKDAMDYPILREENSSWAVHCLRIVNDRDNRFCLMLRGPKHYEITLSPSAYAEILEIITTPPPDNKLHNWEGYHIMDNIRRQVESARHTCDAIIKCLHNMQQEELDKLGDRIHFEERVRSQYGR